MGKEQVYGSGVTSPNLIEFWVLSILDAFLTPFYMLFALLGMNQVFGDGNTGLVGGAFDGFGIVWAD